MQTSEQLSRAEVGAPDSPEAFASGHRPGELMEHEIVPADLHKPSSFTVIVAMGLFVLLLVGLFIVGWIPKHRAQEQAGADAAEIASAAPVVDVIRPEPVSVDHNLDLPCEIKANQDTLLFPRTNGYLKKLYVDIQDHVHSGQLLAEIDSPEVDAQLNQSRANLEQAKANVVTSQSDLDLAQSTLQRYQLAAKNEPGSVTQQDLDEKAAAVSQAQSALASAKASVVAGQADVQRLTVLQGFEKVTAPFAGVITARNYDVGALLSSTDTTDGKELFRITDGDVMRVFVNVPQDDATRIQMGQPAFLTVGNYPGREFKGVVARSSSAIDPNTRTLSLELRFPNPDGALYAGMYGQAKIQVVDSKPLLAIPTSALVFNAKGLQVALLGPGDKVHFQRIRPVRDLGTRIEVAEGLSDADRIIDNPGERLGEGTTVSVASVEHPQVLPERKIAAALKDEK